MATEHFTFTRDAFRGWLTALPQDRPFCHGGICPIATFQKSRGVAGAGNATAHEADDYLADVIDNYLSDNYDWSRVVPAAVLTVMDKIK